MRGWPPGHLRIRRVEDFGPFFLFSREDCHTPPHNSSFPFKKCVVDLFVFFFFFVVLYKFIARYKTLTVSFVSLVRCISDDHCGS